jgi:hypothetical protein
VKTLIHILSVLLIGCLHWVNAGPLEPRVVQRIPLPDVAGRLESMAFDSQGFRLFVAAPDHNTIEVIDMTQGKRALSLPGIQAPQDLVFIPESNRLLISSANGVVTVFNAASYEPVVSLDFRKDAGHLLYDPHSKQVYVGYGRAMGILNSNFQYVGGAFLPGHPEDFRLDEDGQKIFVNIPTVQQVAVLNAKSGALMESWPLKQAYENYPLVLDESNRLVLVGCREPAHLVAFEQPTGREAFRLSLDGEVGDLVLDPRQRQLIAACGKGFLNVFDQTDQATYQLSHRVKTAPGAQTLLLLPEWKLLFLAVPAQPKQPAEIRIYSTNRGTLPP